MSTQPTPTRHGQWRINAAGELIDESQPATETATPAEAEAVPASPASTRRKKSTEEQ